MSRETQNKRITDFLAGRCHFVQDGLKDYHVAQDVKAALRCKTPVRQVFALRQAVKHYSVQVNVNREGAFELVGKTDGKVLVL
jgi:hypothetical protein